MRRTSHKQRLAVVAVVAGVACVAFACGSSTQSEFDPPKTDPLPSDPSGNFGGPDGGAGTSCTPQTCADVKANCGPIGDGCGGIVQCGTCTGEETCGGGGAASACGKPSCTPKTCQELGATCGPVGDGCGGVITSCGTCNTAAGEICGGGGASRCGTGLPGTVDGGASCSPKTCATAGANCGPVADGCGGLIASCGTCASPQTCGGGATPSNCGGTACKPKTCAAAGATCGPIADGCGGVVQCGTCTVAGEICGGGGTPSVCGNNVATPCTGLCTQQTKCAGGGTTSLSGTVFSPAGNLPIYGAVVYVPNSAVTGFPAGVSCDQCGAAASGTPLVTTTTGPDGSFILPNVPVSDPAKVQNIPVVIQLGRWRKQITVQTTACANTPLTSAQTSLPKNKAEGDIPLTAISTGTIDALECVLRKIGISDSEFTDGNGPGRIHIYPDNGAIPYADHCSTGVANPCGTTCKAPATCVKAPAASALYGTQTELDKHDLVIFGCVGEEETKAVAAKQRVQAYANKGGRVYGTHYSYVWMDDIAPWSATASWNPEQDQWTSVTANVDTSFPKGQAFAQWLGIVGALSSPLPNPKITVLEARHDVDAPIIAPAQAWLTTTSPKTSVQHYTYNTEWGKPAAQQCGRVLYSDFHVTTNSSTEGVVFPNECTSGALTAQEKVLAFFLFDLASCVTVPVPPPPVCAAKTCPQQGLQCGLAGDGCGNTIDCGPCPAGSTCGGGGVSSVCGAPACNKLACAAGQCGSIADGCGGTVLCPPCAAGQVCGGGGANVCGTAVCNKLTCAAAAAGSCGPVADGCGGILSCACPAGQPCVNGKCGQPPCSPRTCSQAGANCGQIADGCGGILACGGCLAPDTCGGGGNANICGGGVH